MKENLPKLVVIILSHNEKIYLEQCIHSLQKQTYRNFEIVVVDNASTDGSVEHIGHKFPDLELIRLENNLGYAGGNNIGLRLSFERGAELVLLLNADTVADTGMIQELVNSYEAHVSTAVGLIQPVILLESDYERINTIGNAIHFCGFGYCKDYNKKATDYDLSQDRAIISVSGAALLVSKNYFETVGEFDEDFFMYNEDQNYSWRGLMLGYQHRLSAKAFVYHRYSFSKNSLKMYHSEKNRWLMLLENYEATTLLLLLPILVLLELLLMFHSLLHGWFFKKLQSYWFLINHMKSIKTKRQVIQRSRKTGDGHIIPLFDSNLLFAVTDSFLMTHVLNPVLTGYYRAILTIKGKS